MRCYPAQTIGFLLIMLTLFLSNCSSETCKCSITEDQIRMNDSVRSVLTEEEYLRDYWQRFNEPKFSEVKTEMYRFARKKCFDERIVIYRVEKTENQFLLHKKEYEGETCFPDKRDSLIYEFTRVLSHEEWNGLKKTLNDNCFWTMAPDYNDKGPMLDPDFFLFEGTSPEPNICTHKNYHFVGTAVPDSILYLIADKFIALEPDPENPKK